MGKSRMNKKTFPCGHRGFGKTCRRCLEAERLRYFAESGKKYQTNKEHPDPKVKPRTWTKEDLLAEAERLEEEGRKIL